MKNMNLFAGMLAKLLAAFTMLLTVPSVGMAAAVHRHFIDPDRFPILDQHDVCNLPNPNFGCGPSAAITSLGYLDEQRLIPRRDPPRPLYDDMVAAAHTIAGPDYMATTAAGTTMTQFITGVNRYLAAKLATSGSYMMSAQMGAAWGGGAGNPKPSFVTDLQVPTWQFLLAQLSRDWAVQIGIDGNNADGTRGGHWLTVTGFYFADFDFDDVIDAGTDIAYIRYVDPWSGQTGQADIWSMSGGSLLTSNYVGAAHDSSGELKFSDIRLIAAVAEQVPEPGTALLLGAAAIAGCIARIRTSRLRAGSR
jgi:hypothetical protein